ncbi:hypothetical protein KI387_017403, partial [Taxus chinensis]
DPNNASYEVLYKNVNADNFVGFVDGKEHKIEECRCIEQVGSPWTLLFDVTCSKFGNGV